MPLKGNRVLELSIISAIYIGLISSQFVGIGEYVFSGSFNMRDGSIYWSLAIGGVFSGLIFFVNVFYLVPGLLSKGQYARYVLLLGLLFIGSTFLEELVDIVIGNWFGLPESLSLLYDDNELSRTRNIGLKTWVTNLIVVIFSLVYRFTKDWLVNERVKQNLEKEKLNTELEFLKGQINPHLIFNTLNGIFALARKNKDYEVADALHKLSEMLRFMLYDYSESKVPLSKEVELIHYLIELQRLRWGEADLKVSFDINGDWEHIKIAPMLLIPFVENAFKYGVKGRDNSKIEIQLNVLRDVLIFQVINDYEQRESEPGDSSGIGLFNLRRRLELIYGNNHELVTEIDDNTFKGLLRLRLE